jgi:hypothetical protein
LLYIKDQINPMTRAETVTGKKITVRWNSFNLSALEIRRKDIIRAIPTCPTVHITTMIRLLYADLQNSASFARSR